VIKAVDVVPRLRAVARFTTKRGAVGALPRHFLFELAFVRIFVARRAPAVVEFERKDLVGSASESGFVAIGTRHSRMGAGQREPRVTVLGDSIGRAVPIDDRVAVFAPVLVRCGGKLIVMRVLVAVRAQLELHFVDGVFTGRNMAFRAIYFGVFALQRVFRGVMLFHAEQ